MSGGRTTMGSATRIPGLSTTSAIKKPTSSASICRPTPIPCCGSPITARHGYPWLSHRLSYRRTNHDNIPVRGYKEEGTTTTPFDMVVRNDLDRFHLVSDVIDRVPKLGYLAAYAKQEMRDKLIEHKQYITRYGDDLPEVKQWRWPEPASV